MRQAAVLVFVAILTAPGRADDARAVVERAVKAHGGEAALKKAAAFTSSAKGTRAVAGREVAYTRALEANLPRSLRQEVTLGGRVRTVVRLDGDKATQTDGGTANELRGPRVKELRAEADVMWLATLVPVLGEGVTLSAAKEEAVGGEQAVGVLAARKGHADVTLHFSKKTGLLVRIARRGPVAGQEAEMTWTFGGHKEVGGVKRPTKEVQAVGGKKVAELAVQWGAAKP